jgi:aldoxime dehydratase
MSGEIREHAYWGSARDRIPRAQTDALSPAGALALDEIGRSSLGRRIRVRPHDNICLIRSGQDWTDSAPDERALYDADIRPHLEAGMRFLANDRGQLGCYFNRFVRTMDAEGAFVDKSYAIGVWRSLGDLEQWASHHPTHLAIFSAGVAYMRKLGPKAGLRTYHEISVVRADEQFFEYLNCHDRTGMLNARMAADAAA